MTSIADGIPIPIPETPPSENGDEEINELDGDDYEKQRIANIKQRDDLLAQLGLGSSSTSNTSSKLFGQKPQSKSKLPTLSVQESRRRKELRAKEAVLKRSIEPSRRSNRLAAREVEHKSLVDDDDLTPPPPIIRPSQPIIPKGKSITLTPGPSYSSSDQEEFAPAPRPTRGEEGRLIFEGRWKNVFTPNLTPEEMFKGGAFGGGFFADTYSNILKKPLSSKEDIESLPFILANPSLTAKLLSNDDPDGENNRWKVRAGQSLQEWEKAGWIWPEDPRGWAQWYVRFWEGRRCVDDERQVRRWLKVAGSTGRFKRALLKKIMQSGGRNAIADEDVGAVLRQCLWQWAYELTEGEFDKAMEGE
ncbi:uncharacterized protein L201_007039 [Kwoniella dendrophila CBS 6074]|uniref:Transcription activator GCR1-like domain-containing protein n=1 Tax=Kwoniella dendrophila CBS 6074 TaxID=1295534 RepID=A0AAX4K5K8_9TREE